MASLQGSLPIHSRHSSYFPPAPIKHRPTNDMEKPSNNQNTFRFPLTKKILWDQTPVGPLVQLYPWHTRNISLDVSEAAVRLAHRHALQADTKPHHGFLVGSMVVDPDEQGLTVTLDRFDPGRDVPGRKARLPTIKLPADFIVPLTTILGDADISATHTSDDFISAFKLLENNLSTHGSVEPSRCLTLRAMCRCHSNTDDITLCLHFGAVMVATVFNGFPVKPVPIIPTALARNLMGPLSLSDVQGSYKTGFLSMDKTRKLLLLLESDPKTSTIPLIGIWLSGITHMSNPVVWSACLRFINSSGIQERVCSPNGGFLVVLFPSTSRQPVYYECMVTTEQEPKFMLVGCRENLHIFKHASAKGKPPVQMELTPARSGPSKSLFMQSLAQQTSTQKHPRPSSRRRSSASDSMLSGKSHEESQLMPRPSPKPILDKSPSVMPSVPELSFISESFCEPTNQRTTNQVTNTHPEHQPGRNVHRQRLNGQSEGITKGRNGQVSVNRRRLHGTSKTPPIQNVGHLPLSSVVKGTDRINQQNRPGPLRALNGQELDNARRKGHQSGETHDVGKRTSQAKDKSGRTMPIQSSGFGQRHADKKSQDRHSLPHGSHRHSTGGTAKDRTLHASVHGRPEVRLQDQHIQQSKASSRNQEKCDIPSMHILPEEMYQQQSEPSVGPDTAPAHRHPGAPTSHDHSPMNSPLIDTEIRGRPDMPFCRFDNAQGSKSHEGRSHPGTYDHHQDSPGGPYTNPGHSNPVSTAPLQSPVCPKNQNAETVIVEDVQSSMDRSDAALDQSRSGVDTKTLEQLQRQEEMIQQLQEQIKLILQANVPQRPTSAPLGLMTPPATPQGPQNMANDPQVHLPAGTGLHRSQPDLHSHNQSLPAVMPSPQHERDVPTPESIVQTHSASTSMTAITIHQQATIASSNRQSLQTPVMCSMAVNTGQSLFWSMPNEESPDLQSDQGYPKPARHIDTTSHGPAAMPGFTSTPTGPQISIEEQRSDVQEHSGHVHQETRKESETINLVSCSESAGKSAHSAQSSPQHTPNCSPERSHDGSTFGADLSSPTLGESASTYAPPRHHSQHESDTDTSDSEEEEDREVDKDERRVKEDKRANMASPSLLYRDEKRFYDNLLGQVQQLLHTDSTELPSPIIPEQSNEPDLPRALPDISMATLEELEKLGINLHSDDISITDRSLYRSLYNVSPDLHPHINYVSMADFTFDPSDLSMEANAIAMKYLSDGELAKLSAGFQGDKTPGRRGGGGVNPLLRSVLTGIREEGGARGGAGVWEEGGAKGGGVDSSMGVNMSLASRKYMEKYGLMSEGGTDTASPRGYGYLPKPSPVRFMKSPAIARTNLPTERKTEEKPKSKAKPTRLSYSPARDTHQSEGIGVNTPEMTHQCEGVGVGTPRVRDTNQTPDPQPPNVLGHFKAQTPDKNQGSLREGDSSPKGNILDIGKLKQLPKLL